MRFWASCLLVCAFSQPFAVAGAKGETPCYYQELLGDDVAGEQSLFLPVSLDRARELMFDSMHAAGFQIRQEERKTGITKARRFSLHLGGEIEKKSGKKKSGAGGEQLLVRYEEGSKDGTPGTTIFIESKKTVLVGKGRQRFWTTAIMDQAKCLYRLFDEGGSGSIGRSEHRPVQGKTETKLRDGTPIRLLLHRYLFSKTAEVGQRVQFFVAEDVVVDGSTVISRGMPAWGTIVEAKEGRAFGRAGKLAFAVEGVTAVDGSEIPLRSDAEAVGGARGSEVAGAVLMTPIFGALIQGAEVGLRAASEFVAYVDRDAVVKVP